MSKRPYPWEEDYQRQFKTHVNDQSARCNNSAHMNDVYERTHALLFEGARRAAMQPAMPQDGLPGSSNQPPDVLDTISNMGDMEIDDYESYEMRRSRLDKLRNMEKRDPSPVPSMQNLLTSFINTTRRTHGPFSEAEKDSLMQQAKIYKQLNIDTFVRGRDIRGNSNENHMERGEHHKDENDNKQMDI